jgi:N-methylhydantoinase A
MLGGMQTDRQTCLAVDTGGTFTDVVVWDGRSVRTLKLASTPADPSQAVLAGIREATGLAGTGVPALLVHGSTVATNALLEGRGATVVLITNAGFEDIIELARQARPRLYSLGGEARRDLVPASHRLGIAGRLGADGSELGAIDPQELARLPARLEELGAQSVAVVLLHSYADPSHELALGEALSGSGLHCTLSSELLREYREYERTATTVANAYVAPVMSRYLGRLEEAAPAERIRIMGSSGGALSIAGARHAPAHTILSGPAGGVAGALHVAGRHGLQRIMTFDMGGTSTDVSLCPGGPLHTREFAVAGLPVALPVLDIHTVGAGGGSIARLDAGGALRVGPESAGAVPGPIAYGRGGTAFTVTDANVALGRLPGGRGALRIDASLVDEPLGRLAGKLNSTPGAAAEGVVAVVNAAMEGALRVISVERGYDPVDFTLVPFGGAAGLHAVALAERLGIPRLLLPPSPGVLSAYGMLVAPVRRDASQTILLRDPDAARLEPVFRELESAALASMETDGIAAGDVAIQRSVAARYAGQSHELAVPGENWRAAFHQAHEQRFGYAVPEAPVEAVTVRVEAVGPIPDMPAPELSAAAGPPSASGEGQVRFEGDVVSSRHYERDALRSGHVLHGPALVLESTATFWLPPEWRARVLHDGSLLVER